MQTGLIVTAGTLIEPPSNRPFSIHAPDSVWVVHAGKLDLFLVRSANGEFAGARHHIIRIEQGHAVFGMDPFDHCEAVIVASATPGTQLLCLPGSHFRELTRSLDPAVAADASSLLEDWISCLAVVAAGAPPPKFFIELKAGAILEVPDETKPIMPAHGVIWIEHLRGVSRFLNKPEIDAVGAGQYFPVSRHGWLQPEPHSRILSLGVEEWAEMDPEWQWLERFHSVILRCLILHRREQENKEETRLLGQSESEAAILRGALRTLASPLEKDGKPPISEGSAKNPIIAACEAAGKSLGVNIVSPPEMRGGGRLKDPVASIARASSLRYRTVALKGKWWTASASGPLIAFRDSDDRPMALLPTPHRGYDLYDPVECKTIPVDPSVAITLNGFAYSFYRPLANRKLKVWDLFAFGLQDSKRELTIIALMGIATGLLGMVIPIATGIIFSSAIPNAQRSQLVQISVFLVVAAVATTLFGLTGSFATLRLQGKLGASLQAAVWDRLLRLPPGFFRLYTSGDLAERSLGIEYVLAMLTGPTISSILYGVFSIFSFLLLFYYSWQLALVASGLIFVAFAASAACAWFQLRYQREIFRLRGHISGMLLEFTGNIAKLRIFGLEARAFGAWAREFAAQKELSIRAWSLTNRLTVFNSAFSVISLLVIFACATHLMSQPLLHGLTTGTFLAFLAAFVQFEAATFQLNSAIESVLGIVPICERVAPIFKAAPEVEEGKKDPGELTGSLEISHVCFRYRPDTPFVVRDVSLTVKPGQFVAIVGPSGSGKSTLLRLLLGFEKPDSGAIYYDGQDLAGLDIQAVRRQIGVVIQNARLVSGSIFENIVGSAPLTHEDAWEAARMAGLDQDIREMPMNMHSFISEGGGNLSGGQRQRLQIARAIVKKPRIFLFDEATSSLDNQTQSIVSRNLNSLRATRIVIAHRLSTIINADRILVVENGELVQSGPYEELINREGLFRDMARRQLS